MWPSILFLSLSMYNYYALSVHTRTSQTGRLNLPSLAIRIEKCSSEICYTTIFSTYMYIVNFWPIPKFHDQLITCSSQLKRHDFKIKWRKEEKKRADITGQHRYIFGYLFMPPWVDTSVRKQRTVFLSWFLNLTTDMYALTSM